MTAVETQPIVAGFDGEGDWHDGGTGRYAPKGWSSAKALALRAIRGAFALTAAKEAGDDGIDLEAADDYLSRLGIAKGAAVRVRYTDDRYGLITPDGGRPVKVKWERFADHLPDPDAPRPVPTVTKNTTKADKGVGAATAARIKAAGGTGQAVVADGYLARHGHPKGATATVSYVDDVHADVHPVEPGGRKVRSKWSHFDDTLVPEPEGLGPRPATGTYEWDLEATVALSAGDLSIDDLRALGANDSTLHSIAATVSQGHSTIEAPTFGWQPLPPTLWHTTTVADAVARDGLRTRAEVGGRGLGGQTSSTISLASDLEHAQAVARGVLEARAAAVGDVTLADMVARAAAGDAGSKPFLNDAYGLLIHLQVVTKLGKDWKPGDPIPPELDTPENRVDAWRKFAFLRSRRGGPRDPLVLANVEALTAIDPEQVKILRVEPASPQAKGMSLDRLGPDAADHGEWRVASGRALKVVETITTGQIDTPPLPLDDAPDEKGPTVALYHGTRRSKLEGIREKGLTPPPGVSPAGWFMLTTSPQQALRYAAGLPDDPSVVLRFDVPEDKIPKPDALTSPTDVVWPGSAHNVYDFPATAYAVRGERLDPEYIGDVLDADAVAALAPEPEPEPATVELHPSDGLDPARYADQKILEWLAKPDLSFPESEAMDLHSAKLTWLFEEGIRQGWNHDQARKAAAEIDEALDKSSDTLVWSRGPLAEAVANVNAGTIDSDLDRGVVVQRAYTDAVWQARYGDAPTLPVSRVVSTDDPDRSTPGVPADGVSSWTIRENEQQVIDWFKLRGLAPEVIRADVDRGRALMLPWGEGRFRSDYVRIKGEVLVGPDRAAEAGAARDLLLDPDADRDVRAAAVFGGKVAGVDVQIVQTTANQPRVSGPEHLTRSEREVTALVSARVDGRDLEASVAVTIVPGVDGEPHITVEPQGSYPPEFEKYLDALADRVGADRLTTYTPTGSGGFDDGRMREFIEAGWTWHPTTDRLGVNHLGQDLSSDDPKNEAAKAWKNWDGHDVADIPPPQALLAPENASIRSAGLRVIWYQAIKDRTGRRSVPELPSEGSYIDWPLVGDLPDGTVVALGRDEYVAVGGKVYPGSTTGPDALEWFSSLAWPEHRILDEEGQVPTQARLVRYRSEPLPPVPGDPDPYPGIAVRGNITPVQPLVYRGQIVLGPGGLRSLPEGTRVRRLYDDNDEDGNPVAYGRQDGHDWVTTFGGQMRPAHDNRPTATERIGGFETDRWMVTEPPTGTYAATPTPDEYQERLRTGLLDAARRLKIPRNGVGAVAPIAVGAADPTDWTAADAHVGFKDVRAATVVLVAGVREWRKQNWPPTASYEDSSVRGTEPVGPLWRIPSRGVTEQSMYSTTPIDGVEPEVLASGGIHGALVDDEGTILWGPSFNKVAWREPQPSPLTDDEVTARIAKIGTVPGDVPLYTVSADGRRTFHDSDVGYWLNSSSSKPDIVYRMSIPGQSSVTGPAQTVVIGKPSIDLRGGSDHSIGWFPYPIGSPEAELAGIDPNDPDRLVLPVDDPRLPAAIDAAWWAEQVANGTAARIEQGLISGQPVAKWMHTAPYASDRFVIGPYEGGDMKVQKLLAAQSAKLINEARENWKIKLKRNGDRFVVADSGTEIPDHMVTYMGLDGDTRVAHLGYDGIVMMLGEDAVTPDYGPVFDPEVPWDERVAHLVAQREKVLATMPGDGTRADTIFTAPDTGLDSRLWSNPSPQDTEHLRRATAIEEYGKAINTLTAGRAAQIRADSSRDGTYRDPAFPTDMVQPLLPNHAKSMSTIVAKIAADLYPGAGNYNDDVPAFLENPTVIDLLDRLKRGEVHIDFKEPQPIAGISEEKIRQAFGRVTIMQQSLSNIERRRGPLIDIVIAHNGQVVDVLVHPDQGGYHTSMTYDSGGDVADQKKVTRRMLKLARDIGLVSKADPRPSIAEIAFLETLEAMGVPTGTNPDIEVGPAVKLGNLDGVAKGNTVKLGTSTSPEAYAAKIGLNAFPRDWTDTLVGRPQRLQFSDDDNFTGGGGWNRNGGEAIKIADPRKHPEHRSTISHEFGHTFERTVPGLPAAEAWYLAARLARSRRQEPVDTGDDGYGTGRRTVVYEDEWARSYSGRVYNRKTIGGNDSYEVFTTGMQSILGMKTWEVDEDLTAWTQGLLGLIRPVASEP